MQIGILIIYDGMNGWENEWTSNDDDGDGMER